VNTEQATGVTPDDMIAAGYVRYDQSGPCHKHADCIYSTTVRGEGKKLYFLHAYYYDRTKRSGDEVFDWPHGWVVEACFFLEDGTYFDVGHNSLNELGIKEMERFYAEIYEVLHCVPDIHNND
jgi:hypothetical protein